MTRRPSAARSIVAARLLLAMAVLGAGGCGGEPSAASVVQPPGLPAIARVTVTPASLALDVTQSQTLAPTAWDAAGNAVSGASFSYATSDDVVASVTSAGVVTGIAPGSASITVSSGGRSATVPVTVTLNAGTVARIDVQPSAVSLAIGTNAQLTPTAYDAQGNLVGGGAFTFTTSNPSIVSVSASGLLTGVALGNATVTVASGNIRTNVAVVVLSAPSGNMIDVVPGTTYQTIVGWEGHEQIGAEDPPNQAAFAIYGNPLLDRLVNELGINRVRMELRSGQEIPVDYFAQYQAGTLDFNGWKATWFMPVNDNADPFTINPAGFQWSWLDSNIDHSIIPLRQRLQARGEKLYVNMCWVDFFQQGPSKPFEVMKSPDEYAEQIVAAFQHMQQKYGFVPDAVEMVLEPEHTSYTPADIARAMVATGQRLRAAGFTPDFIAPSTTSMANAVTYYDAMLKAVPAVSQWIKELAYHRYTQVSIGALQQIAQRAARDRIRTSMLEHNQSGFDQLWEDLTVGNVSAWERFTLAFYSKVDNPASNGVYYQINVANPAAPKINITNVAKLLRQVFFYVRAGAVRVGAVASNPAQFDGIAFRNANGRTVVVVKAAGAGTFTVRNLPPGTYGLNYAAGAQYNVDLPDQTVSGGGSITATIPGKGAFTIYAR